MRSAALFTLSLALSAGVATLGAQQRTTEVTILTRRARAVDSTELVVQRLKQRADSLARLYGDNDDLNAVERQRVGEALDRTVDELERALATMSERMQVGTMHIQLAPLRNTRAADAMARALTANATSTGGPHGWVGLVVNGVAREPRIEGGELIVHYLTYPEILSVEPSSPAERAGIVPGDTLIAYDGRDVRDVDISMTRLLKPNARVIVRVARGGRMRDVPLTVADAPSRIMLRRTDMNGAAISSATASIAVAPGFPRLMVPGTPTPPSAMRRSYSPVATRMTTPMAVAMDGVAGAQMSSLTQDWARQMGVSHGVLVLRVPTGSIAGESGLHDADVIVRAAGQSVRTLTELRDVIATAVSNGQHSVPIEYVREQKSRKGALRW